MDNTLRFRALVHTGIDPFISRLIPRVVPEMMRLATDELRRFDNQGILPSEVTPAAVVAIVLDDVLPLLSAQSGSGWCALRLQCALLDRLAELCAWEQGIPPTRMALAP